MLEDTVKKMQAECRQKSALSKADVECREAMDVTVFRAQLHAVASRSPAPWKDTANLLNLPLGGVETMDPESPAVNP